MSGQAGAGFPFLCRTRDGKTNNPPQWPGVEVRDITEERPLGFFQVAAAPDGTPYFSSNL